MSQSKFKIRSSRAGDISTGTIGLTQKQSEELFKLENKPTDLTKIQGETVAKLIEKRDNLELPQTAISYCEQWMVENRYNRKKEFSNKYTEKGNFVENQSIDFIAKMMGLGMLIKNDQHFENDFMTGTPDVITKDYVIDAKSSWDVFTFPRFASEPDKGLYWMQAQVYMHLTGIHQYKLAYALVDTPEFLIEREARNWCYSNGFDDLESDIYEAFRRKMTYDDIPDEEKIKVFSLGYCEADIKNLIERVELCREYIDNSEHKFQSFKN